MDARPDEVIDLGQATLRRYREQDTGALHAAVAGSLEHLAPWMPWATPEYSRADTARFVATAISDWDGGTAFNYAISVAGTIAGGCGLMQRIGPGGLEIGYWIHADYLRRGLATAASAALAGQAFQLPGVVRVEIVHDERNVASGGVPAKLGFTMTGRRPMDNPSPQGSGTGVVWALTR